LSLFWMATVRDHRVVRERLVLVYPRLFRRRP
jgi:hypothetical protein